MENNKTDKVTISDAFYLGIGLGIVVSPVIIIIIQLAIDQPGRVAFSVTGGLITFAFMVFLKKKKFEITRKKN